MNTANPPLRRPRPSNTEYFRVLPDDAFGAWFLGKPRSPAGAPIDPRDFNECRAFDGGHPVNLSVKAVGKRPDMTFGAFDMVVARRSIAEVVSKDFGVRVQRIPVRIADTRDQFEILNVMDSVACFDPLRSRFTRWEASDAQSQRLGGLRMVAELRIDPRAATGHDLFRVLEWPIALVASRELKQHLEEMGTTGCRFEPV